MTAEAAPILTQDEAERLTLRISLKLDTLADTCVGIASADTPGAIDTT